MSRDHGSDEPSLGAASTPRGYLPLREVSLSGRIEGLLYSIILVQSFSNPYDQPLEVTYIFPLPPRAAVAGYRMRVGKKRRLKGKLQGRSQARQVYAEAMNKGRTASIAEQERPDVFTVRVGNLAAGESLVIELDLEGPLALEGRDAIFRFPLVVSQRYVSGSPLEGEQAGAGTSLDTECVPDASRLNPPVLLPGMPNPVDLRIGLDVISGGLSVTDLQSSLHAIAIERRPGGGHHVSLRPAQRLNRDFVLRLALEAGTLTSSLLVSPGDGAFLLTVVPPAATAPGAGRDVVILLDGSGSMGGWKMVAARTACSRLLESLSIEDRFAVIRFDFEPSVFRAGLTRAGDPEKALATAWLRRQEASGGTELYAALVATEPYFVAPGPEACLIVITDGEVGEHDRLLAWSRRHEGVRIHTIGIGHAPNHGLLDRLASGSGGTSTVVEDGMPQHLSQAFLRLRHAVTGPVLADLQLVGQPILWASPERWDVYPGQPAVFHGCLKNIPEGPMEVVASLPDGGEFRQEVAVSSTESAAVGRAWARSHLLDLEDQWASSPVDLHHLSMARTRAQESADEVRRGRLGRVSRKLLAGMESGLDWASRTEDFWRRKGWPRAGTVLASSCLPICIALGGTAVMARVAADWLAPAGALPPIDREALGREGLTLLELEERIEEVSLRYGVLCRFTAFVSVDRKSKVVGPRWQITQPVEQVLGSDGPFFGPGSCSSGAPTSVVQLMQVDAICMNLGKDFLALVDPKLGALLMARAGEVRKHLARELGVLLPGVRFRDDAGLAPGEFTVEIRGTQVARGEIPSGSHLALGTEAQLQSLEGARGTDPTFGMAAVWLDSQAVEAAQSTGCLVFDPVSVLATALCEAARRYGWQLLGRQETQVLVDAARGRDAELARALDQAALPLGDIQAALRNLLAEHVSIRQITDVLTAMLEGGPALRHPDQMSELARVWLGRQLCDQHTGDDGVLRVFTLEAGYEAYLEGQVRLSPADLGTHLGLVADPDAAGIVADLSCRLRASIHGHRPIVLVSPTLRLAFRRLCQQALPDLVVLSTAELPDDLPLQRLETLEAPATIAVRT